MQLPRHLRTITRRAATAPLALLLALSAAVSLAPSARAQVTVSSSDGLTSAIAGLTTGGTISFTGAGTTSIVNNILLTATPYALNIGGTDQVTIRGLNGSNYLFSNTSGDIDLTLSNITLTNGGAPAIYASGSITLRLAGGDLINITGNHTNSGGYPDAYYGSAVSGSGNITLTGSSASIHITNNYSNQWKRSGVLYSNSGNILIDASTSGTFLIANNYAVPTSEQDGGTFTTWAGSITFSGTHANVLAVSNTTTVNGGVFRVGGSTLVIDAAVSGSFAISNNFAKFSGGAVYVLGGNDGLVSITANGAAGIRFENNIAGRLGGAIQLENGGTIALDAKEGNIVFTGNRHTGDNSFTGTISTIDDAALVPNAIATARNPATIDVKGDHDVLFFDPVYSRGESSVESTLLKAGAGTLLFSGSSLWIGSTTISAGKLLLNNGAFLNTSGRNGTVFTLAPGALLGTYTTAGTGTVMAQALNLSGILYATGTSKLELYSAASSTLNSITIYADVYGGNQSGLVAYQNSVVFTGESKVDLQTIAASSGTFTVFRNAATTALPDTAFSSTLYFHGYAIGAAAETSRLSGSVAVSTSDSKALLAILNESPSLNVTWTGSTSNTLDFLTVNWKRDDTSAPLVTAIGDQITFDDTADTGTVTLAGATASAQISAGAMLVNNSTKDYTFGGTGGIATDAAYVTGNTINGAALGKLVKLGPGRLVFQNDGANTFAAGIDWNQGVISITNGAQLGTGENAALRLLALSSTLQVEGAAAGVLASAIAFAPPGDTGGTLTVRNNSSRIEFSGVISGTGGITLTGTGVTALTGSNTYVGNTTLTEGSALAIGQDAALGAGANTLIITGNTRLEATGSFATARTINIGANNLALAITGDNEFTLAGAAGQLTGTGTVTLAGRLRVEGAGVLGANTHWDITPASRLAITGDQAVASLRNRGLITFSDREVLTTGALSGSGTISMKVDLNGGGDNPRLVVLGAATGEHFLDLTTVGDPGEPRSVNISLIEISGGGDATFTSNLFTDGMNSYEVRPSDTGFNFAYAGNSAAADVILVTAGALGMDWHYSFDNLRLRLGELRTIASPSGLASATGDAQGAKGDLWFRAGTYRVDAGAGVVGAAFKQTSYDITAGIDRAFAQKKGVFLLGGYATMTRSSRRHNIHGSESSSDGIGGGLYATWLRKNGWHLDLIAKYHSYENTVDARNDDRRVTRAEYDSDVFGGSIELGRRLQRRRLWLEPSLQAEAGRFASAEYTAASTSGKSMRIRVDGATAAQYRAQLRGGADFGRWQPYVRIGETRTATTGGKVYSDPYEYTPNFDGWRFETGAGFTLMVDERTMMYVDYEYNKAAEYERPWAFNLGFRRTW